MPGRIEKRKTPTRRTAGDPQSEQWRRAASNVNTPSVENFVRSAHQSLVVMGDHLYIEGGEVSQLSTTDKRLVGVAQRINETLSIALTQSWDTGSVTIRTIPKSGAPSAKSASLFADTGTNSFYAWGGESSYGKEVPQRKFWRFTADGYGGGNWREETPADNGFFSRIIRSAGGSWAKGRDTGYIMGGYGSSWTDQAFNISSKVLLPGLVSYNLTSRTWANESSTAYYDSGTSIGGAAEYVPSFGAEGLIFFLGGATRGSFFDDALDRSGMASFSNITFYDPATKTWHWQSTSGTPPSPRERFCTVGASSKDSHEIFVFGGYSSKLKEAFDDAYVLSVPGFVWSRANYEPRSPRAFHACARAGNRQMISVGGVNYALNATNCWQDQDPFKRGLGVFDLTALKWNDGYDASARTYESPQVVQKWYSEGRQASVAWTSAAVKTMFDIKKAAPSDSPQSQPSNTTTKPPVAAIASGVVGGILLIALAALFFFLRHRKLKADKAKAQAKKKPGRIKPSQSSTDETATLRLNATSPSHSTVNTPTSASPLPPYQDATWNQDAGYYGKPPPSPSATSQHLHPYYQDPNKTLLVEMSSLKPAGELEAVPSQHSLHQRYHELESPATTPGAGGNWRFHPTSAHEMEGSGMTLPAGAANRDFDTITRRS